MTKAMSLEEVAAAMVAPGKGILAADESTGTIRKRFESIRTESTEASRRDYREMLFRSTDAMKTCISGKGQTSVRRYSVKRRSCSPAG